MKLYIPMIGDWNRVSVRLRSEAGEEVGQIVKWQPRNRFRGTWLRYEFLPNEKGAAMGLPALDETNFHKLKAQLIKLAGS